MGQFVEQVAVFGGDDDLHFRELISAKAFLSQALKQ